MIIFIPSKKNTSVNTHNEIKRSHKGRIRWMVVAVADRTASYPTFGRHPYLIERDKLEKTLFLNQLTLFFIKIKILYFKDP